MEGIFLGQAVDGVFSINKTTLTFNHECDIHELHPVIRYSDCDYMLVKADDVIKTNDELLKLRDEVKRLTDECNEWKVRYSTVNNKLFQKGLAYGTLEGAYKNEKIAGEMLLKDRDALKEQVEKLEEELMEIKTTHTLREAYITGVEKGCASLKEDRDLWKRRWNSVVTDIVKSLEANGIEFTLKEIHGDGNWDVVIDIPELNEAEAKVSELENKLKAAKSNETFWRGRKEEEENQHHYWLHTFDRAVKQAADKGIYIDVRGTDEDCNAGVVVVDNVKAKDLEKAFNGVRSERDSLDIQNGSLKEVIYRLKNGAKRLEKDNDTKAKAVVEATDRGDYWKRKYDDLAEYWDNTRKDLVATGEKVGVKIEFKGDKSDNNVGHFDITNEKTIELMVKVSDTKHEYNKRWQAMLDALKDKGVEVIYMGEQDGKPCVDVKIPEIDILKKELEALKSRTLDNVEIRLSCGDIVWTYCDGFVHVSSGISGVISADEINTRHINCLCKNYFDAESISHGTVPKCKTCGHFIHNPSRSADVWCHKPVSKEGPGTIRRLSTEEAEGPACVDFKARKE